MNLVWLKYERFVNNEGISLKTPLLLLIFRGKYDRSKISRNYLLFEPKCRNNAEITYM